VDLDRVLIWTVALFLLGGFVVLARADRRLALRMLPRHLLVGAAMGIAALVAPGRVGAWGLAAWALLLLAPSLVAGAVARAGQGARYARARRLLRLLRLLRPFEREDAGEQFRALA
jgi:hypothetical protein